MLGWINRLLDYLSAYIADRKGLLPLVGIFLVFLNWLLSLLWGAGWLVETNLCLHLGVILAILGFLLAWAL